MSKHKQDPNDALPPFADSIDAAIDGVTGENARSGAGGFSAEADAEMLHHENVELRAEVRSLNDRALRAEAEIDNIRKRLRRDFEDQLRFAALPLVKDMLKVLDNLNRALEAPQTSSSQGGDGGLKQGVQMVADQLKGALAQNHCLAIDVAPGAAFDPHKHEALGQEPSDSIPAGAVSRVVLAGYQMHDRVVRAAQVLLSAGKPS
jgi:molecular chaperone GrpE